MRRAVCLLTVMFAALVIALPVRAQEGERLLAGVPKGYGAVAEQKSPLGPKRMMVPAAETTERWTESVFVQTYSGLGDITPAEFRSGIDRLFAEYCPDGASSKVKDAVENGYPSLTWLAQCARNRQTGKSEFIWTKAIQGRENLYVVQATYRFEPSGNVKAELFRYLDSVLVCDARLPDRPCR